METLLYLFLLQAPLGAFDIVYHHEVTERLTWRPSAAKELRLHGLRNGLYVVIFLTLGWFAWQGVLAWLFGLVLLAEVLVTLWDFVVEDRTRDLPASERVTHAVLAIAYGAILACFVPVLAEWAARPTALVAEHRGWLSWAMTVYAAGCAFWAWRDNVRAVRLAGLARAERNNPTGSLWATLFWGWDQHSRRRPCHPCHPRKRARAQGSPSPSWASPWRASASCCCSAAVGSGSGTNSKLRSFSGSKKATTSSPWCRAAR